jgi:phenylacetate-coenzyme A ligase PaaK-like adenylate-forming protein
MHDSPTYPPEYYERSRSVLETALDEVEAYKPWRAYDPGRGYPIDARYAAMPALTKKIIRENFEKGHMLSNRDVKSGIERGEISFVKTSGTIDVAVTNIWNQTWWDAAERASWKLNAHTQKHATGDHPEAILVNALNVGFISDEAELPMEKRRLARFLYLNEKTDPMLWTPAHMDRMIKELGIFRPVILEANPALLAKLCRYIAASQQKVFQPEIIVLTYDYPAHLHLQQIRAVFHGPVISSYGSTETGYVFMQCEAGKFHQNTEFCRVDVQPMKPEHGGPGLGRMLVTTFNNPWYYVVRFDVGDLARLDEEGPCPCGRDSGLVLSAVEGRATNVTLTTAGRLVSLRELDLALSALEGIDEFRLEQASKGDYRLQLASRRWDKAGLSREAASVLKSIYGREAEVSIEYKEAIPPESSGKYALAKTLFPVNIEHYLDASAVARPRQE